MRRLIPAAARVVRSSLLGGLLGVAALIVPGCRSHGSVLTSADCAGALAPGEGGAAASTGVAPDSLDLDFGALLLGQQEDQQILVSDVGSSALQILKLDPPAAGTGFQVGLSSTGPVQPGGAPLVVAVRFRPVASGATSTQVSLITDCSAGPLVLNLKGEGILPLLQVSPPVLDFGRVLLGSHESRDLLVTNDSEATRALTLFPVQGASSALFRLQSTPPQMLAPHQQITLTVAFSPTAAVRVPSQAALALALDCIGCQAQVDLVGQGVLTGLSVSPNPIDFGAVDPPGSASAALVLANVANTPITLLAPPVLMQAMPNAFQLGPASPLAQATLLPGEQALVPIVFSPLGLGRYQATLTLTTNDPFQGNVSVPMFGISGGPQIQCSPEAVDFSDVGVGVTATARVTCINVGLGNPDDPGTNLYLALATDSAAFSAAFDSPLPLDGLFPGLPAKAAIDVGFTPGSERHELGHLVVTSNDPTTPDLLIALQGNGVVLPACVFQLQPALLDFGQVARGLSRDQQFVIANTGTVDCLVNGLDLSTESSAAFSLPGGPIASERLSPVGSSSGLPSELAVTVRFSPALNHSSRYIPTSEGGSFNGQVQFTLSDPKAPQQVVPLDGLSPDDCLVFDPVSPDFGSVPYDPVNQRWCSATRNLTVSNLCDQDATLVALDVDGGPGSLSAFTIVGPGGTGSWTIPPLLDGGGPATFQLTFRPSHAGLTHEALRAHSLQTVNETSISKALPPDGNCGYAIIEVPLEVEAYRTVSGLAATDGGQVDGFTGRGTQVDLLWIVDTTDPVAWQFAPGDLAPFLQYPMANGIDFQMGVTSASALGAAPAPFVVQDFGSLEPCDHCWLVGSTATIVAPTSQPDPASVLAPLLSIGGTPGFVQLNDIDGTGFDDQFFESFAEVLGPDLLAGHNAGFLRSNSVLAVVALGDYDNDESDGVFSFFYNFLAGVKSRNAVSFSFAGNVGNDPPYGPNFPECNNQLPGLMAQLTGGVTVDASQPGWMAQLAQVWIRISDELFRYPLSSLPADPNPYDASAHPGGLQIAVDGQPQPSSGWHYDPVGNAVIFEPSAAPPAGATLTVGYALGCGG